MIQLDIVAEAGLGLLRAYQVTGNPRWFDAAKHWGDVLAEHCNRQPGQSPWGRYANPEAAQWKDNKQTGGVVFILYFLDELIRLGHSGQDNRLVAARDAGRAYLRDVLLPDWTVNDVWGRNYWDWPDPVQAENVTEFAARYLIDHKDIFPNWRNDVRNILSIFLNHASVSPDGCGDVYSGAWAIPESCGCCGRSLWYDPMELAVPFAQYGVEAQSSWAKELARRMQILATYDVHETGVSEDNIDGGQIVCGDWFKIAHPMALKYVLGTMAWLPEELGASRENHIMRTTTVVNEIQYHPGRIAYSTFDAPVGTIEVLRLAFRPDCVRIADGPRLPLRTCLKERVDLKENGYTIKPLPNGDFLVTVRHDGQRRVQVRGTTDPQSVAFAAPEGRKYASLDFQGHWSSAPRMTRVAEEAGASMTHKFKGNQIRVIGDVAPDGGLADVYLDGVKQLVGIDCWNPTVRHGQVLYYCSGMPDAGHVIKLVVQGSKNPRSTGAKVLLGFVTWSAAQGTSRLGEGGGPTDTQRMIFGYPGREDYKDSAGNLWRPATEFVVRSGHGTDSVAASWWTRPCREPIAGAKDPELYRYGVHAKEFWANVTVGPGAYHVRLKMAATRGLDSGRNCVSVSINGHPVVTKMDVAATAGGPNRAADLVFNHIEPQNGVIEIRFIGGDPEKKVAGEAFVQAIEVGPGDDGSGTAPKSVVP